MDIVDGIKINKEGSIRPKCDYKKRFFKDQHLHWDGAFISVGVRSGKDNYWEKRRNDEQQRKYNKNMLK